MLNKPIYHDVRKQQLSPLPPSQLDAPLTLDQQLTAMRDDALREATATEALHRGSLEAAEARGRAEGIESAYAAMVARIPGRRTR